MYKLNNELQIKIKIYIGTETTFVFYGLTLPLLNETKKK